MQHNFLREQLPADTKTVYNYRVTGDMVSPAAWIGFGLTHRPLGNPNAFWAEGISYFGQKTV